ncbi:hypothetical protein F4778DRAFT_802634 [Xylariomycetidae sp. FL2044]|nr:hypothetical protein F4778DRAFT_802634 [Xylariomycetidae sp. FL2044]
MMPTNWVDLQFGARTIKVTNQHWRSSSATAEPLLASRDRMIVSSQEDLTPSRPRLVSNLLAVTIRISISVSPKKDLLCGGSVSMPSHADYGGNDYNTHTEYDHTEYDHTDYDGMPMTEYQNSGLHVHVGRGRNRFSAVDLRRIAAFLYAADSTLVQMHPEHRARSHYCESAPSSIDIMSGQSVIPPSLVTNGQVVILPAEVADNQKDDVFEKLCRPNVSYSETLTSGLPEIALSSFF